MAMSEWKEPTKTWVGMGNPCDETNLDLFYACTTITIGDGAKTPFWDAPWVQDRKPKEIAPLIYEASSWKNWMVKDAWVSKIKITINFTIEHIRQFINLWTLLSGFVTHEHVADEIVWKHTANGQYSAASA